MKQEEAFWSDASTDDGHGISVVFCLTSLFPLDTVLASFATLILIEMCSTCLSQKPSDIFSWSLGHDAGAAKVLLERFSSGVQHRQRNAVRGHLETNRAVRK